MDIARLIDDLIKREGGYVDHPADRGGPTNWGITAGTARAHGYAGAIEDMPRDTAASIYRHIYWEQPGFARIAETSETIAAELFDTGVNMGPVTAIGFLQRALNALNRGTRDYADLALDHCIGEATLAALRGFLVLRGKPGEIVLHRALNALQGERYIRLTETRPANEAFAYGWIANRIG